MLKDSAAKVKLTPGIYAVGVLTAIPDDLYISGITGCRMAGSRSNFLVTTASEVIIYGKQGAVWRANLADLRVGTRGLDWLTLTGANDSVEIAHGMGSRKKVVEHFAMAQQSIEESEMLVASLRLVASLPKVVPPKVPKVVPPKVPKILPAEGWPNSKIVGSELTQKASDAILRQSHEDEPWFILIVNKVGLLAAFDDRLTIIKTTRDDWRSQSLVGEKAATFFYSDVTGLEYKSGSSAGVLEVLTASYNGTATKDYPGAMRDNPRSNKARKYDNPYMLSNTLWLPKVLYNIALDDIKELRRRIARYKQQVVIAPSSPQLPSTNTASLGDELMKLAELNKAGVLSDDEFQSAKKRLLG